jgi:hypothetical protein
VFLARFQTYKFALPPQIKIKKGMGPQTDKHMPPNPFTCKFVRKVFRVWCLHGYLVHGLLQVGSQHSRAKNQQRMV